MLATTMQDTDRLAALLRPSLAELSPYVPAHVPEGVAHLDANESPWGLSDDARRSLADAIARVEMNRYPDVRATALREIVAAENGVHPDRVVPGCGSDEVIAMLMTALANPPAGRSDASVLFPAPTFVMYRQSARSLGLRARAVPLDDDFDLDADALLAAVREERPNVVFLASPNNPTGTLFARDRIAAVIEAARDSLVVLDEAYAAFAGVTYRAERDANPHVAQLQTISKIGLAALRVGWAILPVGVARAVDTVRLPYNLSATSQAAAVHCLTTLRPELDAAVRRIVAERDRVAPLLAALEDVRVWPSAANFWWIRVPRDAAAVHAGMLRRGVAVRSFHTHGGALARQLRITVGTPEENDRMLAALRGALADEP